MNFLTLEAPGLVFGILVFVALMLLAESLYLLWRSYRGPEASRLKQRIEAISAPADTDGSILKQRLQREPTWARRLLARVPRLRVLDHLLLQSGLEWSVAGLLVNMGLAYVVVAAAAHLLLRTGPITMLVVGLAGPLLVLGFVAWLRARRVARLERQLPDALDLMVRALRAGHAFGSTLKITADEVAQPIGGELQMVHDEMNFGISLDQALNHLCDRVPSTSVRYFSVAVLVQRDAGGNLTEILDNLSRLLRSRRKLMDKIRILSAEGRLSAWVLAVLPFVLAGVLTLANPSFMTPLWTDPLGQSMVRVLLIMMVVGGLIMRRIVRIHV